MLFQHRNLVARVERPGHHRTQVRPRRSCPRCSRWRRWTPCTGTSTWRPTPSSSSAWSSPLKAPETPKRCKPWRADFGNHGERCQIAVQVALPSLAVTASANLLLPWINHSSNLTVAELRAINLKEPRLRSRVGCRLVTCWLDFAVRPAEFTAAMNTQGRPPAGHVTPPAAAASPTEASASTARPSTPPPASEPATAPAAATSATPRPPPVHQPVSLAPVADWLLPPARGRGAARSLAPTLALQKPPPSRPASAASTRSLPPSPRPGQSRPGSQGTRGVDTARRGWPHDAFADSALACEDDRSCRRRRRRR